MTKDRLQSHVENHFGMSLYDFISCRTKVESLRDYEIANILNVNSAMKASIPGSRTPGISSAMKPRIRKGR